MKFGKIGNVNKTNYYSHGSTLVPQDICCGDIIETKGGKKAGIILGLIYNTQTQMIQQIHIANITRNPVIPHGRKILTIPSSAKPFGDVSGIDLPADVYTHQTSWYNLGQIAGDSKRIERIGRISPTYLEEILATLKTDNVTALPSIPEGCIYVPSLQYLMDKNPASLSNGLLPYGKVDDYDLAMLVRELNDPSRIVDGDEVHHQYIDDLKKLQKEGFQGYLKGKSRAKQLNRMEVAMRRSGSSTPRTLVSAKLAASFDKVTILDQPLQPIIHQSSVDADSLQATFGEQASTPKIILPKPLWRGRYMMINVANLDGEPSVPEGKIVQRPCIVWKAYADKQTGQTVGLELHPVTRSESERYIFKMRVYPLRTRSKKESWLVADCVIRASLDSEFFDGNILPDFFELTQDKIRKLSETKIFMERREAPQQIIGLQTIPDHWVEVRLDDMPSAQQQRRADHQPPNGSLQEKLRGLMNLRMPA